VKEREREMERGRGRAREKERERERERERKRACMRVYFAHTQIKLKIVGPRRRLMAQTEALLHKASSKGLKRAVKDTPPPRRGQVEFVRRAFDLSLCVVSFNCDAGGGDLSGARQRRANLQG